MATATSGPSILIDGRAVGHPTAGERGIGRYVAGLIGGLAAIDADVTVAVSSPGEADVLRAAAPDARLESWSPSLARRAANDGAWYVATQLMLHPLALDPIPNVVTRAGLPVAAIMYDVIPQRHPERYLADPNARQLATVRTMLARTVDRMLAISDFSARTASRVMKFPYEHMRVVGAGVSTAFRPTTDDTWTRLERVGRMGVRSRRSAVVAVTGTDDRKNTEGLLRAWSLVRADLRRLAQLVVACGYDTATLARWIDVAQSTGLTIGDDVVFTGALSDDEMAALVQASSLVVFPSIEEGFGLPVAEAAACGRPVICSDTTSLPEVIDCSEATFDPYDPAAIAHAIEWAFDDDDHHRRLLEASSRAAERWTWRRVATDTVAAVAEWDRVVGRLRPDDRPRIALIGTAAEFASGELRRRAGELGVEENAVVDVFVDALPLDAPRLVGARSSAVIGRYVPRHDFDRVICSSNSTDSEVVAECRAAGVPVHLGWSA